MELHTVIIDGLDGAGKATTAQSISDIYTAHDFDAIIVSYPAYDTPLGKVLRDMLDHGSDLDVEQRMALYAANRLETLPWLEQQLDQSQAAGRNAVVIFDRFACSNLVTAAAYELQDSKYTLGLDEVISKMLKVDAPFLNKLDSLGLRTKPVIVPMMNIEQALASLSKDISRKNVDQYEQLSVQELARQKYLELSQLHDSPFQLQVFSQMRDGTRMQPLEVAQQVIELSGYDLGRDASNGNKRECIHYKYLPQHTQASAEILRGHMRRHGLNHLL